MCLSPFPLNSLEEYIKAIKVVEHGAQRHARSPGAPSCREGTWAGASPVGRQFSVRMRRKLIDFPHGPGRLRAGGNHTLEGVDLGREGISRRVGWRLNSQRLDLVPPLEVPSSFPPSLPQHRQGNESLILRRACSRQVPVSAEDGAR